MIDNIPKVTNNNNYVIIETKTKKYLYSYNKLIAIYINNKMYLTQYHDFSTTTRKHLDNFIINYTELKNNDIKSLINNKTIKLLNI